MKLNHIGIVCRNIENKMKSYIENYGYKAVSSILLIENQGVRVVLLNNGNDVNIELVEPISPDSPVMSFLKRGGGINHVCYEVDNFEELYNKFKSKVVREPKPAPMEYFKGGRTFFIFKDGDLVEFLERK